MLALLVAVALLVPAVPAAAKAPTNTDSEQIRRVFEMGFDFSRRIDDRLAFFEHGGELRSTIVDLPGVRLGVRRDGLRAQVSDVRVYGRRAEVHFALVTARSSLGELLPFGVAVYRDGSWKISEHTLCSVAALLGGVCRNHNPSEESRRRWQERPFRLHEGLDFNNVIHPITFADGTTVGIRLPAGTSFRRWYVTSRASLRVAGWVQSLSIVFRAERLPTLTTYASRDGPAVILDYEGALNFAVGGWTVAVDAGQLSPEYRALVARELQPRLTPDGMVAVDTGSHLELHTSAPANGGSRVRKGPRLSDELAPVVVLTPNGAGDLNGAVYLAHEQCQQLAIDVTASPSRPPARCWDEIGVELSAEGFDADFVSRLLAESDVHLAC